MNSHISLTVTLLKAEEHVFVIAVRVSPDHGAMVIGSAIKIDASTFKKCIGSKESIMKNSRQEYLLPVKEGCSAMP